MKTRAIQWTFFAWLKLSSESSADCGVTGRDALRLWGTYYEANEAFPEENDFLTPKSKFYADILETYGAEEIVNRLVWEYRDEVARLYALKPGNSFYSAALSKLMWNLGDYEEMSNAVVSSELLTLLVSRVERYENAHRFQQDYGNVIVVFR